MNHVNGITRTPDGQVIINEVPSLRLAPEPDEEEQQFISECILRIIDFRQTEEDKKRMTEIITHLQNKGAQAIILGCSDLFLLIHQVNSPLPLINSTEVLERSVVERLMKEG